jgi:hypothetical protein
MKALAKGSIAKAVARHNATASKNQVKPIDTGGDDPKLQRAILAYWSQLETVTASKVIISPELRVADRTNGAKRRQWCADNKALMVNISTIVRRNGSGRPENSLREKLDTLIGVNGLAPVQRVGYIRVLDSGVANSDPKHALADMVYIYRTA